MTQASSRGATTRVASDLIKSENQQNEHSPIIKHQKIHALTKSKQASTESANYIPQNYSYKKSLPMYVDVRKGGGASGSMRSQVNSMSDHIGNVGSGKAVKGKVEINSS